MIKISKEVQEAIKNNIPVVALESTIISHGMPYPKNVETALNVEKIVAILPYTTIATIQRLGYLLEYVLEESQLANDLYSKISQQNQLKSILLDTKQQKNPNNTPNRWHVNANVEIEIDELW